MGSVRIQKFLSESGVCSRRVAEEYMREGRVQVNGEVVTLLGTRVDPAQDVISVDGRTIEHEQIKKIVLAFHKPTGVLCTERDPEGRPTVYQLLPPDLPRLFSIGRLDWSSEGLLMFTNDGDLANAMMHPSTGMIREYEVKVKGHPTRRALHQMIKGTEDKKGNKMVPMEVEFMRRTQKNCWYRILMREGRYHEVREICGAADLTVLRLVRVGYGPVRLDGILSKDFRKLNGEEVQTLRENCQLGNKRKRRLANGVVDTLGPPKPPADD